MHATFGFGHQPHVFAINGHRFPFKISEPEAMNLYARQFAPMGTIDVVLEGGAGGLDSRSGGYLYRDGRNAFFEGGLRGIVRVHDTGIAPKPQNTTRPPRGGGKNEYGGIIG